MEVHGSPHILQCSVNRNPGHALSDPLTNGSTEHTGAGFMALDALDRPHGVRVCLSLLVYVTQKWKFREF